MLNRVDEHYDVKISDKCLASDLHRSDYFFPGHLREPLPVRWMAPESLQTGKFTTESDVVK